MKGKYGMGDHRCPNVHSCLSSTKTLLTLSLVKLWCGTYVKCESLVILHPFCSQTPLQLRRNIQSSCRFLSLQKGRGPERNMSEMLWLQIWVQNGQTFYLKTNYVFIWYILILGDQSLWPDILCGTLYEEHVYKSHIIANEKGESLSRSQTHSECFIVPNLNWGYRVCSQNHQLCIQKTWYISGIYCQLGDDTTCHPLQETETSIDFMKGFSDTKISLKCSLFVPRLHLMMGPPGERACWHLAWSLPMKPYQVWKWLPKGARIVHSNCREQDPKIQPVHTSTTNLWHV